MPKITDYEPIVGSHTIEELRLLAGKLQGKVIQNVNSTAVGGGVAEILNRMVPLLQELGVDARWDFIKGGESFFNATKKFHNALHGKPEEITPQMFEIFMETSQRNIGEVRFYGDIMFIHDPQPIALIKKKSSMPGSKWVWRCHIDVSTPNKQVWDFLMPFIHQYDGAVFSAPAFSQPLPIRQFLISPSIDPLSDKNRDLPQETIEKVLEKYQIPKDKPIITQISRFDYLKDPVGVIDAYHLVKKHIDCQLIIAGGTATDDPESTKVFAETKEAAGNDADIHILPIPSGSDVEINALQRASTVIVQKSLREGFGLTVTEALWKAKPVVASCTGGIPLQVKHKYSGLLCRSVSGAAFAIKQLLNSPEYAKRLGENGMAKVGLVSTTTAIVGVICPFLLAFVFCQLLKLTLITTLFIGTTLAATSVGLTARVFADLKKLETKEAQIIIGAAIIDDVIGLIVLSIVSGIGVSGFISFVAIEKTMS